MLTDFVNGTEINRNLILVKFRKDRIGSLVVYKGAFRCLQHTVNAQLPIQESQDVKKKLMSCQKNKSRVYYLFT